MSNENLIEKRFNRTLKFLAKVEPTGKRVLDLGTRNTLSAQMESVGYIVENTKGEDLDLAPEALKSYAEVDFVTAFEILEHLVSPFPLLRALPAKRLVATVPLRLWFAKAYRHKTNKFDMHYHEFEDWQFDMLLEKAGWKIVHREKWTSPTYEIGFRPLLRFFYPRFYAVHAIRIE